MNGEPFHGDSRDVLAMAKSIHARIRYLDTRHETKESVLVQLSGRDASGLGTMFASQPQYEFPIPPDLAEPGCKHWRMFELTLHAPWFLLSTEIVDPQDRDLRMTRTLCIAWDSDLAKVLRSLDVARVKGIVCMMPAWLSVSGQWTSREIREVWLCKSAAGEGVLLRDVDGKQFDCGLTPDHVAPMEQELLLRVGGPSKPARRPKRSAAPPAPWSGV